MYPNQLASNVVFYEDQAQAKQTKQVKYGLFRNSNRGRDILFIHFMSE